MSYIAREANELSTGDAGFYSNVFVMPMHMDGL